jgi:SAM-dependent methyltransferase
MKLHTSQLAEFADVVVKSGGDANKADVFPDYDANDIEYDTNVDQDLDPFSDEYFAQQLKLYSEIAGRDLDQSSGELHPVDIESLLRAPNPFDSPIVSTVGEHLRVLSTMLSIASLRDNPEVLDMGAGHGLSSELFGLAGCRVHAVDIDPALGELSLRRAELRGYQLRRSILNFDDAYKLEDNSYDAAFFYQSLHHCLRPWDLIEVLRKKLKPDGVIAFAGEPIQSAWWRHWGIRLDRESIFVARQYGWFESGFSAAFIKECFKRAGMELLFFSGGFMGQEIGIATGSPERHEMVLNQARLRGFNEIAPKAIANGRGDPAGFSSMTGTLEVRDGQSGFRQVGNTEGALLHGPYTDLEKGEYEFEIMLDRRGDSAGVVALDIISDLGAVSIFAETVSAATINGPTMIRRKFTVNEVAHKVEIRAIISGGEGWFVSIPTWRRLSKRVKWNWLAGAG